MTNGIRTHGTATCYRNGCRLPECREALRLDMRKRRGSLNTHGDPHWTTYKVAPVPDTAFTRAELLAARGIA